MCLSYCYRREETLFWNHWDCHPLDCEFADGNFPQDWQCATCQHRKVGSEGGEPFCGLTGASLPDRGGCCHYNVSLPDATTVLARDLVGQPWQTTLADLLEWLGVPYQEQPDGAVLVSLRDLEEAGGGPKTYGVGTEPEEEAEDIELGQTALSPEDEGRVIEGFDLSEAFV